MNHASHPFTDPSAAACASGGCAAGSPGTTSVRTRVRFASPPRRVWDGLMFYEQIGERPPLLLRLLLPVPIGTEPGKAVVGHTVRCAYERGHLIKRVTHIDEGRHYGFEIAEQDLAVGGGLALSGGCYALTAVAAGGTDLAVTTRYVGGRRPRWLWKRVEAAVCHRFHRHLLEAMKRRIDCGV